jgi:hypothetical protein
MIRFDCPKCGHSGFAKNRKEYGVCYKCDPKKELRMNHCNYCRKETEDNDDGDCYECGFSRQTIHIPNPFLDKAQSKEFTEPLSMNNTRLLLLAVTNEMKGETLELWPSHIINMIDTKIKELELPIKFNHMGMLTLLALSDGNPGRAVSILIDCLTLHEGQEITADMLCEMYPWGHYNEKTFADYVDNYLKPRKVKWSELY